MSRIQPVRDGKGSRSREQLAVGFEHRELSQPPMYKINGIDSVIIITADVCSAQQVLE